MNWKILHFLLVYDLKSNDEDLSRKNIREKIYDKKYTTKKLQCKIYKKEVQFPLPHFFAML